MNTVRATGRNLKEIVFSVNFMAAVLILFCALFAECMDVLPNWKWPNEYMGGAYFFNIAMNFGYYIYAAPLVCAFAASGLFVDDTEAGFYRLRLMKSSKKPYKNGLFLGVALGGGFALFSGVMLFAVVCFAMYGPTQEMTDIAAFDAWLPLLMSPGADWMYMIANALLAFLFGAIWSCIGLTFTVVSPNRYVGYLAPFIVCFCVQLFLPPSLRPLEMLLQMRWVTFRFAKLLIYQIVLFVAVFLVFHIVIERRFCREK